MKIKESFIIIFIGVIILFFSLANKDLGTLQKVPLTIIGIALLLLGVAFENKRFKESYIDIPRPERGEDQTFY